jgi:hypothetical protein
MNTMSLMTRWRDRLVAAVIGIASATCSHALADERIIVTYSGTVSITNDPTGIFAGAGDRFTDQFVFDVNKIYRVQLLPNLDELIGGPVYGTPSPALESELDIGGVTLDLPLNLVGQDFNSSGFEMLSEAQGQTASGLWAYNVERVFTNAPELVTTDYSGPARAENGDGFFICMGQGVSCGQYLVSGTLSPSAVSVVDVLPEPASWGLMILGFGGLGAMLRHRHRALAERRSF